MRPTARRSTAAAFPVFFRVFRVFRGSTIWSWEGHPDFAKGTFQDTSTLRWRRVFRRFRTLEALP